MSERHEGLTLWGAIWLMFVIFAFYCLTMFALFEHHTDVTTQLDRIETLLEEGQ